jgi:rod shape-determining protein MreD
MNKLNVRLLCAFIIVLVVSILPVSGWLFNLNPPWILLFVLYVQIFSPQLFSLTWVFLLGLCCDVLFFSAMGSHVIAFLLPCWIISVFSKRFVFLSILHQLLWILVCCVVYQLVIYGIGVVSGSHQALWLNLCAALFGMLLWPWFRFCIEFNVIKV